MSPRPRPGSEREQLDLFRALPGDLAPRDAQDLMAYPFFSLAKSHRTRPIDFKAGNVTIPALNLESNLDSNFLAAAGPLPAVSAGWRARS